MVLFPVLSFAQEEVLANPRIALQTVITGFSSVTDIASAGDDRLFIVEQAGRIWILDGSTRLDSAFLNITGRVTSSSNEQGLLGLAFHPDYENNGYFYVNYTTGTGGNTRISRFSVRTDDPDRADPDSELIILIQSQPLANHNGGCLKFGPDGYLYIGMGDGGGAGDPQNRSQNKTSLLGKMLRIDVNTGATYTVPADNPFVEDDTYAPEIWALGLRNPWRFSFDRLTGDLWISDVGQSAREEINFQPASSAGGENYGWRCYEGNLTYNTSGCSGPSAYTFPVYEYNHVGGGRSVTGGFVYRGTEFPALYGKYIFSDFINGEFFILTPQEEGSVQAFRQLGTQSLVATFGENDAGDIFGANRGGGARIFKVTDACNGFKMTVQKENACGGNDGSITLETSGGTGPFTILWNDGNNDLERTGLSEGVYSVSISGSNNCVIEHSVSIAAAIIPDISYDEETFTLSSTNAVNYQWYKDGAPYEPEGIPQTGQTTTATGWGNYSVVTVDENGCEATSGEILIQLTSVTGNRPGTTLKIFPNPAGDRIWVTHDLQAGSSELQIIDATGRKMGKWNLDNSPYGLDVSHFPPGMYLLRLHTVTGEIIHGRFVRY